MTRYMPLAEGTYTLASGFGPRWGTLHYGLDFAAADGTPIYAAQAGTVAYIGAAQGFGQWIVLDHPESAGGGATVYGHMWDAYATGLSVGDWVDAGQVIAYVGSAGESTGLHCHFEVHPSVWRAGSQIDPAPWLEGATEPGTRPLAQKGDPMTHYGIDISGWQAGIDLARVAREGFAFVLAKASQGTDYVSPEYTTQRDQAADAGLLFGAYHYVSQEDAAAQVDNYERVEPNRAYPVMLDHEEGSGDISTLRAVCAEFRARGYVVNLVYLPQWYWRDHIGSPDLAGLPPLMASSYVLGGGLPASVLYPGDDDSRWTGYGGNTVAILQFSDRGQVAGMTLDVNAFRGSRNDLAELFGRQQEGEEMAASEDILAAVRDIRAQLTGSPNVGEYPGWAQLGSKDGAPMTLVDSIGDIRTRLAALETAMAAAASHGEGASA
ncbi:hypothetical protein D5S18_02940 [Nocardia panacis]|uniref:M23ase beta-sheet core domain-containing protein n=1 Tax=Nocardia panacis TaxID=2340916 RepID=A0A3A4K389_9NOCA|nr:peptidoglycan DD-metalloendopeptidase family protein [Nocardia panacis]RJO79303.1 hypothetical protein D5S18_02940 [Nocardia panacis]